MHTRLTAITDTAWSRVEVYGRAANGDMGWTTAGAVRPNHDGYSTCYRFPEADGSLDLHGAAPPLIAPSMHDAVSALVARHERALPAPAVPPAVSALGAAVASGPAFAAMLATIPETPPMTGSAATAADVARAELAGATTEPAATVAPRVEPSSGAGVSPTAAVPAKRARKSKPVA